ncbi:EI24 domain-containing protein [Micromonospora sp. HM5-17]|uniref:EI24 domain-containing protein n=1 Tax=Micromonospora sp. HM5-17 TaxID=2487710 RepID=UPI000F498982|nr:EI24 domain-containing protein [Micromonospora sp. HM5-17]ROT26255.1 hypothetical protein EF879_25735 [Micromonospora sp. HM5-17]
MPRPDPETVRETTVAPDPARSFGHPGFVPSAGPTPMPPEVTPPPVPGQVTPTVAPVPPAAPARWRWPRQRSAPDAEPVRAAGRVLVTHAAEVGRAAAAGATRGARAAAHGATRPIVNLAAGIGCFLRGLWRFLTSPVLWPYAVAPLVLLGLALYGLAHGMEAAGAAVVGWATSFADGWPRWIHDLLGGILLWGVRLAVHILLGYLVLPLSVVLAAPCYVLLARRVERTLADGGAPSVAPPPLWRSWLVAVRQAILVTLVVQFGWLLLVPLLLIPGLNVVMALGAVTLFNGFLVGLLMLAIPLHHHGVTSARAQVSAVWRHRASVIGFGAISALLLSLPVTPLRAIVAPVVFTGAVLLHHRMRRLDAARAGAAVTAPAPGAAPPSPAGVTGAPALPPAGVSDGSPPDR